MNPGISFPLREAELPHESKRKTEVAKTRNFSRSAVGKHLLVRGYDCYESPSQSAGERIRCCSLSRGRNHSTDSLVLTEVKDIATPLEYEFTAHSLAEQLRPGKQGSHMTSSYLVRRDIFGSIPLLAWKYSPYSTSQVGCSPIILPLTWYVFTNG